jgi:hypothetical protein
MLQMYKDFVEVAFRRVITSTLFTNISSDLHMFVIVIVYTGLKNERRKANENQSQ